MKKTVFKKGFTLIELMIVIVILGVLMGTILPRLTGAQARARDTGRIADLNTISQALETFFDDNGEYPGVQGTPECLDPAGTTYGSISSYLKGNQVPQPASSQVNGSGTATASDAANGICVGAYVYIPLANRGVEKNGYVIMSDVETYQKANAVLDDNLVANIDELTWPPVAEGSQTTPDTTNVSGDVNTDSDQLSLADDDNAANTVYVLYN